MKGFKWFFIITACLGIGVGVAGLALYGFDFDQVGSDLRSEHQYEGRYMVLSQSDIDVLNFDIRGRNIIVREGSQFRLDYYFSSHCRYIVNGNDTDNRPIIVNRQLSFGLRQQFNFPMFNIQPARFHRIYVTVPAGFGGDINIVGRSGNVNVENIGAGDLYVNMRSGNIRVANVTADEITITNRSGNIRLENIRSNDIAVYNRSGNNTVSVVGNRNNFAIALSHRSGRSTVNGARVVSNYTSPGSPGNITMNVRSGNNTLNFV